MSEKTLVKFLLGIISCIVGLIGLVIAINAMSDYNSLFGSSFFSSDYDDNVTLAKWINIVILIFGIIDIIVAFVVSHEERDDKTSSVVRVFHDTSDFWRCPKCHKENANYVGTCGCGERKPSIVVEENHKKAVEEAEAKKFCASCGEKVSFGQSFCRSCGSKL